MEWIVLAPLILFWLVGGPITGKKVIAAYEADCMRKWGPGGTQLERGVKPQYTMDGTDWSNAIFRALGVMIAFPILVAFKLGSYPVRWAWTPVRSFFLPPVQKAHEVHVADLQTNIKALESSVGTYMGFVRGEPPVASGELHQLESVIQEQWNNLMDIMEPDNAFDQDLKEELKARIGWDDYKELTA